MRKRGKFLTSVNFTLIIIIICILNLGTLDAKKEENKFNDHLKKKFEKISNETKYDVIIKIDKSNFKEKNWKYSNNQKYKDYIYKRVNYSEFLELNLNSEVNQIYENKKIKLFLSESRTIIKADETQRIKYNGINLTGIGQTVCEIDTGVDFSHPDLIGTNSSCIIDCFNKSICIENCSIGDDNGHGTMVAGILASSGGITGIAPGIKITGVKVLNNNGEGSESMLDLSRAIDYCVSQNVSVISLSLGTSELYDQECGQDVSPWQDSINQAFMKNISIIAAAGNNGNHTHIAAPACIGNVTAVGITYDNSLGSVSWSNSSINDILCTDNFAFTDIIACASNRNNLIRLFAPGAMISTTIPGGGYTQGGGSSMSAPHVSAAFAIFYQIMNITNQSKNPKQIELIFNSTGKEIHDISTNINYSRIDLFEAIISMDNLFPNVTLINPGNNSRINYRNIIFSCNSIDIALANMTFYLWKNNILINNTKLNATLSYSNNSMRIYSLEEGNYEWNCLYTDLNNNRAFSSSNFSFNIIEPVFGVLHSMHSNISDGYANPNQRQENLQNHYEWASTVEHDQQINTSEWEGLKEEANGNNSENFTYFLGYEWRGTSSNNAESLIFFKDNGPSNKINGNESATNTFLELSQWLQNNNGIGCINHPSRNGNTINWNENGINNQSFFPCIEMINKEYLHWNDYFNCSNLTECITYPNPSQDVSNWSGAVKNALDNGYVLGFVAGWDYHGINGEPNAYTGLADPYNFSREGIFETIKNRHTWASQDRITMDINVNNGSQRFIMGDQFSIKSRYLDYNYSIYSSPGKNIENISLYYDGIIINFTSSINQENVSGMIRIIIDNSNQHYIFLETIQSDSNRSFASPVYIRSQLIDNPPQILGITTSTSQTGAIINLFTDVNSNYSINYGNDYNLTQNLTNNSFGSILTISLDSLTSASNYYYNLTLCDNYNHCNTSGVYNFSTTSENHYYREGGSGGGSSSGGIKQANNIFIPLDIELEQGYNQSLKMEDKIKFNLNNCEYFFIVKEIVDKKIFVEIKGSDGSIFSYWMGINEFEKLTLNSSKYNFYFKINGISEDYANVSIKKIDEDVINKQKSSNHTIYAFNNERPEEKKINILGTILFYAIIATLIILILFVIYYFAKVEIIRNKQKEHLKDYRQRFLDSLNPKK
jgi:hypothetical protein